MNREELSKLEDELEPLERCERLKGLYARWDAECALGGSTRSSAETFGPGNEAGTLFPCLKDETGGSYLAVVYVDAGEGVICWHKPGRQEGQWRTSASGQLQLFVDTTTGEVLQTRRVAEPEVRADQNLKRADRRARHEARLYCERNRLSKMWTLTLAEIMSKEEVKRHVNRLMREWRERNGGRDFPYLYVLELCADGERWHVHLAVPKGYTDKRRLQRSWGLGLIRFDESPWAQRRGISGRERARRLAMYLCKYISKAMGEQHRRGEHRYERAQGFGVERVRRSFAMLDNAEAWLRSQEGGEWVLAWDSIDIADWEAPPAWGYRQE
jgi:hypothetical protein